MEALTACGIFAIAFIGGFGVALVFQIKEEIIRLESFLRNWLQRIVVALENLDKHLTEVPTVPPAPSNELPAGMYMPMFKEDSPVGSLIPLEQAAKLVGKPSQ